MKNEFLQRLLSSLIILPLSIYFIIQGENLFIIFLSILFIIASFEWFKMTKVDILKISGLFFLFFSFVSTYILREQNLENFLLIIIICVSTDLGGFFFGKFFKGPKLTKISPNKTYSGLVGSFLFSIIFSNLYIYYFDLLLFKNMSSLLFFLLILIISSVSQIGDLLVSYIKRLAKIKNTGNILPGHGGLLDRIDGMVFVFPFVYIISLVL